jgi:hypothetical protein
MSDIKAVKAELAGVELVGFRIDRADGADAGAGKLAAAKSGVIKLGAFKVGFLKSGQTKPRRIA